MGSNNSHAPKILFALLDWGMGHATRTAPLIQYAIDQGWEVHIGTKGTAMAFLRSQFKDQAIVFHDKPGPDISYSERGTWFKIAGQIPAFLKSIQEETDWTESFVREVGITHIVSDNCYGVHHQEVPSVLISHQLKLPVPKGLDGLAQMFVENHARHFQSVWIPDDPKLKLSGSLAHGSLPNAQFIGVLSRLPSNVTPGKWKRVGMVSGPEPHRSLMESALLNWFEQADDGPCLLIAGRPGDGIIEKGKITIHPDPTADELASALLGADTLVCRSGYSSLMDIAALGKRAILIPTPGQPEQLYLAKHWNATFGSATCTQVQLEKGEIPNIEGRAVHTIPNESAYQALHELVSKS